MRKRILAAVVFIAVAGCRDGPTAPETPRTTVKSGSALRSVAAEESLDRVRSELRGPFVQTLVRTNFDDTFADDLLVAVPSADSAASADELGAAETSLRSVAAHVERIAPTAAGANPGSACRSSVEEAAIARDVLRLILGDALQSVALQRARMRGANEPQL